MVVAYYLLIKFRWEIIILFWWTRLEVADNGGGFCVVGTTGGGWSLMGITGKLVLVESSVE